MKHFWPLPLKTQTIAILCSFFLLSHVVNLYLYELNRGKIVLLTEATDLAARIIGIVNLANSFPSEDRRQILKAAETQFLATFPAGNLVEDINCESNDFSRRMAQRLSEAFASTPGVAAEVCLREFSSPPLARDTGSVHGFDVLVSIDFPDSESALFHAVLPEGESILRDVAVIYFLVSGLSALLIVWYLIRKTTVPLERLAAAADKFGNDIDAPTLDESGPREVSAAARAFNRMQLRLRQLVHEQTEMLAAISHDLRSAVTRLQLRTELLRDKNEREGMLRVVEDMGQMIQSVLHFLRGIDSGEAPKRTDIVSLVQSLSHDLREEGYPVRFRETESHFFKNCRPTAFRRALQNLVNNAVKYGGEAVIEVRTGAEGLRIIVEDSGPGIPEDQLDNVLKPFIRLEKSRNFATGGVGLGLPIAVNIFRAHGGILRLLNRGTGGLRVEVSFTPDEADVRPEGS